MRKGIFSVISVLILLLAPTSGKLVAAAASKPTPILSGPLAKLDIKDAVIETARGKPRGKLTVAQHFALDPGWLDPLEHIYALTQQTYDYLVHDALIKPMPQGEATYSLAEHAEMTADFRKAAFRLRPGLKFHDGQPLTTADVKWTYENYKGSHAKIFRDKLEQIQTVDDRTIVFHFKAPFLEFIELYNGGVSGIGWVIPKHYYEKVGREGFKARPLGAGPYKFVSQQAGVQMDFEAWEEVLAPYAGHQDHRRQGHPGQRGASGCHADRRVGPGLRDDGKSVSAGGGRQKLALGSQFYRALVAHVPRVQRTRESLP
jgi:ABC-type transport system substrate-binding protein